MRKVRHLIVISSNVLDLKGVGEEWLVSADGANLIAKFVDGNFVQALPTIDNKEITAKAA